MTLPHLVAACLALPACADPNIPGLFPSHYSDLGTGQLPFSMTLGDDGALFVSSNNNAPEGVFVKRIPYGGGLATFFNHDPIYDADGVLYDRSGEFSGVPGAILVGCTTVSSSDGIIRAIRSDGSSFIVAGPRADLNNADIMAFDSLGRLYVNVPGLGRVTRFVGLVPTVFATLPTGVSGDMLAIDALDRLWVTCSDARLRRYSPDGSLDVSITMGSRDAGLAFCPGGPLPRGIYLTDNSRGLLLRVNAQDVFETVGTSLQPTYAIGFDSTSVYLAEYSSGHVWRLAECRADFNGDSFLDFFDYDEYVNCFETGVCSPGSTADFNRDGFVDFFDYDDFVAAFETGC